MRHPVSCTFHGLVGHRGRAKVLSALFSGPDSQDPEHRYWLRELGRDTKLGFYGLYCELGWLEALGLIKKRREGGAMFIEAKMDDPLAKALAELVKQCNAKDGPDARY